MGRNKHCQLWIFYCKYILNIILWNTVFWYKFLYEFASNLFCIFWEEMFVFKNVNDLIQIYSNLLIFITLLFIFRKTLLSSYFIYLIEFIFHSLYILTLFGHFICPNCHMKKVLLVFCQCVSQLAFSCAYNSYRFCLIEIRLHNTLSV